MFKTVENIRPRLHLHLPQNQKRNPPPPKPKNEPHPPPPPKKKKLKSRTKAKPKLTKSELLPVNIDGFEKNKMTKKRPLAENNHMTG